MEWHRGKKRMAANTVTQVGKDYQYWNHWWKTDEEKMFMHSHTESPHRLVINY